ncbi:MAG TPA: hypothetical protein VFE33_25530 [Thermoanaerobaculia bacterium]|nr:hypothetical protein [Thermoanaerobaculia bacterium]
MIRKSSQLRRKIVPMQIFLLLLIVFQDSAFAFKQRYHEQITEDILANLSFDRDSADEAGDSNYWTDVFESYSDAAHADNNMLSAASARLRTKRTQIGDALNSCRRRKALDTLGEALHTVQDIYSHSNSIDNGIPVPDVLNMSDGTATCSLPSFAPGGLVTGYFSLFNFLTGNQCRFQPANMCCHRDLNKDAPDEPNGGRHTQALDAARTATRGYLDLVEQDIRSRFGEPKATQLIKLFKQRQRTIFFVIDDTGSMSDNIAGVKAQVNSFLDDVIASNETPTLGLLTFKDEVTDHGETCDVEDLRRAVNALSASGGGDCPEASNSAMLAALQHIPAVGSDMQLQGGRLLVATDASARDAFLGPQVAAEALLRGASIDAILTGDCASESAVGTKGAAERPSLNEPGTGSPALMPRAAESDPLTSASSRTQLRALAEATGGVLFNVDRAEVDDVVPTLLELSRPDVANLLSRNVELVDATPQSFEIPVDDTLRESVTFMITASQAGILPSVILRRPNGTPVAATDGDVVVRSLSSVQSFTITAPAVGRWKVEMTGAGSFILRTFGGTTFRLDSVRLQERSTGAERPETDVVPLQGQPVAGSTLVADFRFTDAPRSLSVSLRKPSGALIQDVAPLTPIDGVRRFRADLSVPSQAFVVETTGLTAGGTEFIRQVPLSSTPQTVAVDATPASQIATPGTSATIEVRVRNAGAAETTFQLRATGGLPWTISGPASIVVPAGAEKNATFTVQVRADAAEGSSDTITLFAEKAGAPQVRNNASATVIAGAAPRALDCAAATASPASLWPPDHRFVDIHIEGLTTSDGSPAIVKLTGITQDEALDAPRSGHSAPDAICSDTARLRAERSGSGDGRVYEIRFMARDGHGKRCFGSVQVGVPRNEGGTAIDSGQRFDSTAVNP